jgi:hypothetical protein
MKLALMLVALIACESTDHVQTTVTEAPVVEPAGTPAGRQFTAWLAAFNAADRAAMVAYHDEQFPYAVASEDVKTIDRELGLNRATGGFEVKKLESPGAKSVVATMKEKRSDQFARVELEVAADAPHHVVRFEIHPIPTPAELLSAEEGAARVVDDAKRRALIDGIAKELDAHYIFPEVARQMIAALRDHVARGDYDAITDSEAFVRKLTDDLRAVSHDKHLGVHFGRMGPAGKEPTPEELAAFGREVNYGFGPIERLSGNVAHVVIDGFPPADGREARDAIGVLMSKVADADALIIDLRNNGGGHPETVALIASYVFDPTPVHLNDMYWRDTDATRPSWTLRDLRGTRFGSKKPVYVLTSARTFSGGEEFAYDLQALRRATLVGETTGGGAHPVQSHPLDAWFGIGVPSGRPINPITKTNWEGTGVVPDVAVPVDKALDEAHRRAVADIAAKK